MGSFYFSHVRLRFDFELRPDLSSVRFVEAGNLIPAGDLVHYCKMLDSSVAPQSPIADPENEINGCLDYG
jgi:hypothetical protein